MIDGNLLARLVLIAQLKRFALGIIIAGALTGMILMSGCGTRAAANDMHVERIYGPDGSTCYVIVQNGNAVGGNCVVNQ